MPYDYPTLFSWLNMLAMIGWALLLLAPRRWNWLLIVTGIVIPSILGVIYGGLILAHMSSIEGGGYSSLQQVRNLMNNDPMLVAGWSHYLCFDLLVATLIAREADKAGIIRLVQIPMLMGTFMFGPAGLILFFLTFALWKLPNFFKKRIGLSAKSAVEAKENLHLSVNPSHFSNTKSTASAR